MIDRIGEEVLQSGKDITTPVLSCPSQQKQCPLTSSATGLDTRDTSEKNLQFEQSQQNCKYKREMGSYIID